MTTIGILGAGKLGTVLATLSTGAGYRTLISGSGEPGDLAIILSVLSPDAIAARSAEVVREADIVILALPLGKHHTVPASELRGKIVIDAMNYWPPTDGVIEEFEDLPDSSTIVARTLSDARLVKAFSHLGYHELKEDARPRDAADRHGIVVAGDDMAAVAAVAGLVDDFGFDPVVLESLSAGSVVGAGTPLFGVSAPASELRSRIASSSSGRVSPVQV